jgi:hypothetical protein
MEHLNFVSLFGSRNRCLLFNLTENSCDNFGWIGGNAPAFFDDKISLVNDENTKYYFYLTFKNILNENKSISIFIPHNEVMYTNIYPRCSIKVIEHEVTFESEKQLFKNVNISKNFIQFYKERHDFEHRYADDDEENVDDDVEDYFIKLGGKPYWIQDEEKNYAGKLIKDGYEYFLQIDEYGYLPNMVKGNYPFCFGTLYIYCKIDNKNINNFIAGFWQR